MDSTATTWMSLHWFSPQTLGGFEWEFPIFLYLIAAVPLVFLLRWLLATRLRQKLEIALPEKSPMHFSRTALLRFLPPLFLGLAFAFMLLAMARPQLTDEQVDQWTEGIDIVLALDLSESMLIEDFKPNRLEAAKEVAKDFIDGRKNDRIGLVMFAGDAISYAPLTNDYKLLKELLSEVDSRMIDKPGTAIGSALGVSINRMRESEARSKVVVLLSDGANTAGQIDPKTAAQLAYAYGVKVYSIGVGTEGAVPFGTDMFGNPRYVQQTMDESTLREIAQIGQGQYFRAQSKDALENIFKRIDQYEKAQIKENRYRDTRDYYFIYLTYGIFCWLLWLLTKSTFMTNGLED